VSRNFQCAVFVIFDLYFGDGGDWTICYQLAMYGFIFFEGGDWDFYVVGYSFGGSFYYSTFFLALSTTCDPGLKMVSKCVCERVISKI